MQTVPVEVGARGPKVRSDVWMRLTVAEEGGRRVELKSRVRVAYGDAILALTEEVLDHFGLEHVVLEIEDAGAVPYVHAARLEAAIRAAGADAGKRFLPEWAAEVPESPRDRMRRSRLYLPGDQPKLHLNAALHGADALILDLEDSVAPSAKDQARVLVRNALRGMDFFGAERMVRINQLPLGLKDLEEIIPHKPDCLLVPKVERPEQLVELDEAATRLLAEAGSEHPLHFVPLIESALGVVNAYAIATASERNVALTIGLEDYTADIGAARTRAGLESFYARSAVVNAARAAGIQPLDTVFSDVQDAEGLIESVREARGLGFDGKGCIHPRQVAPIHKAFAPTPEALDRAKRIVLAFEEAERQGRGVVALGSKMIDPPVVLRAQRALHLARSAGMLSESWREEHNG